MSPERLRQIEELYHAAREGTPDDRAALLAQADPELRREVESLLREPPGGEFLDAPAIRNAVFLPDDRTVTRLDSGSRLGPYRLEHKLGEGGMGEVFRAVDTRLGRSVAIKITREQFNARFQREARAISSLNHPNICILHDVGPNYFVMELVEGETVAGRLKKGPLPHEEALRYGSQIAAALEAAHAKGIVHRDLKPGNVMLTKSGAKVLDFGLATLEGDQTLTTERMVMGTPAYMAPEQREGRPADVRTDVYAFGLLLYEMLSGERAGHQRRRLRARKLEKVVSRCLEDDPARRWQSAAELLNELAAIPKVSRTPSTASRRTLNRFPKAAPKARIVIGEFENGTGDPVFDGILRQGLSVQLEQSPSLTLVSDQQMQQTLRMMNQAPETRITPEVAQEICQRTGGTAVLQGSIASLGNRYVLWLRASNCLTGDVLGQEQAQAESKEQVLEALTRIAAQIRERLGESLSAIREHSTPLEQATTRSLEALKAYTAARHAMYTRGMAAAIPLLQRAISIDPQFAMAQADLGFFYWNTGQTDLGAGYVRQAYEQRDRVSERERLFILFLYDRQVTGNLHKELATLESWAEAYPGDYLPLGLTGGWGTRGTGLYERGIQSSERALRMNPDLTPPLGNVIELNICLGRFDEAAAAIQRAVDRKMEVPQYLVNRYYLAFLTGDEAGMKRELDRARGNLEAEDWMWHNQALVLARSGQIRNARVLWQQTIDRAHQSGHGEKAALYRAAHAVCEAHLGNRDRAKEAARSDLALGKGRDVEYAAAFALALSGDLAGSKTLAENLAKRFPEDTPVQYEYLPTLYALFAMSDGAPQDALERLQTALPYDLAMPGTTFFAKFGGLYTAYVRGLAYMQAGLSAEGAAEFQKVLDHRGIVLADPIGALAHLQLGRALAASGDLDRAKSAYNHFLTLWTNADPDLPVLKEARAEFAKL